MERIVNFKDQKAQSELPAEKIKEIIFPLLDTLNPESVSKATLAEDRQGTDYWVKCRYRTLSVDLKYRSKDWSVDNPDVALELISDISRNKIGWAIDDNKRTQLLLVYYADSGRTHLWSFRKLKKACKKYLKVWAEEYKTTKKKTQTYYDEWESLCVYVPVNVLVKAMNEKD